MSIKSPPPGTPAAELQALAEQEAALAEQEAALIARAAESERTAGEIHAAIDDARNTLLALANSAVHAEAEQGFNALVALAVPPLTVNAQTVEALKLRRQAVAARTQALAVEQASLGERFQTLERLEREANRLLKHAAELDQKRKAEEQRAKQAEEAEKARALLTAVVQPPAPTPAPEPLRAKKAPPPPAPAKQEPAREAPKHHRAVQRIPLATEVSLHSESNFFAGFTQDISEMGVFVATYSRMLPPGTEIDLTLNLPGKPAMQVHGVVRWIRDPSDHSPGVFPGMGIAFQNVDPSDLDHIKRFVKGREPLFWAE